MERKRHAPKEARPRVIITRPDPDAAVFAEMVRAAGFAPVLSPALRIVFAARPVSLSGVAALAFTSANGVRALKAALRPAAMPVSLLTFAVGEASAAAAREAGFANVRVAAGEVASLSELIAATLLPHAGELLHVAGHERAGDLVGRLESCGIAARLEALYEAVPAASLSAAAAAMLSAPAPADWATFFSPRSARIFVNLASAAGMADSLTQMRAACLSAAVAASARTARWGAVEIADAPSAGALIELMRRETPGASLRA